MFADHDDLVVVATSQIASTGLNIPRIFNLFLVDLGKSFVKVIQSIGRGLRTAHDKDKVSVYDICSDLKYGKKHVRERMNFYAEARYPHKKIRIEYNKYVDLV
jgi:superfamily II DNA or RNA helicase